jgi:hypothetical protein
MQATTSERLTQVDGDDLNQVAAMLWSRKGGFNRWIQHTRGCVNRRSVADEAKATDLLHGKPESAYVYKTLLDRKAIKRSSKENTKLRNTR